MNATGKSLINMNQPMNYSIIHTPVILLFLFVSGCSNTLGPENDEIPTTIISFTIEEPGHVKLWVENAYKTKVLTLVDEQKNAGNYTVTIEWIDENGNRLPYGMYTYFLETDSLSISRTFVLNQ